jgi:hypothetical protein
MEGEKTNRNEQRTRLQGWLWPLSDFWASEGLRLIAGFAPLGLEEVGLSETAAKTVGSGYHWRFRRRNETG